MKLKLLFTFFLTTLAVVYGQSNWPGFQCLYDGSGGQQAMNMTTQVSTGTKHMIIILCVEQGQSTAIPASDIKKFSLPGGIPDYINRATFGNWQVIIDTVMVNDNDGTTAHAFVLPAGQIENNNVVSASGAENVISQADNKYNFGNYDNDHNGYVDYVAFIVYRYANAHSTGTWGLPLTNYPYLTNDYEGSVQVKISGAPGDAVVLRNNNGINRVIATTVHEMGHSLFSWPDVTHRGWNIVYNHSSFGDFSVMSSSWGGFQGIASLYNPVFRVLRGWATPTDALGTKIFSDFDATGQIYSYNMPSLSGAFSNQALYFTYYTKDQNNPFQANWPVPPLPDGIHHAGVLAWRTIGTNYFSTPAYEDRKDMPITLVSAHGKWDWNENNPPDLHDINTGQPDILNGLDSLQEPFSYVWGKFAGNDLNGNPIYDWQLYQGNLYQIGSASCFFNPEANNNFAFYSNPSSNEVASADKSRSFSSSFAMKDLRWESGQAKADFVTGSSAYTITNNATLTAGTWYINNTITVASGVTLTIQQGARLIFNNNASLVVNGTLNAQGISGNNITFDFVSQNSSTQNGIIINSTGTASISYADISNAYNGVKITPSSYQSTIENCNVHDCYDGISVQYGSKDADLIISGNTVHNNSHYGIYVTNSGYGMNSEPTISFNTVSGCAHGIYLYGIGEGLSLSYNNSDYNTSGAGIAMYYSSPYITGNGISYNYTGIGCSDLSSPDICNTNVPINNYVHNNNSGIYILSSSNPFLGEVDFYQLWGNNMIEDNTSMNIVAGVTNTILAQGNWWGANPPDANKISGPVDYSNYIQQDPSLKIAVNNNPSFQTLNQKDLLLSVKNIDNSKINSRQYITASDVAADPDWPIIKKILYARNLIKAKDYEPAETILKDIINSYPDSSLSCYAINLLWNSYRNNGISSLKSYLNLLTNKHIDKKVYGLADLILAYYGKDNAPAMLDNIIKYYSNGDIRQTALFSKFLCYINVKADKNLASTVLTEIDNKYPGSYISEDAHIQLGDKANSSNKYGVENKRDSILNENSLNNNNLSVNYPNPFNPSTMITYSLKEKDHVTLIVYNILGKEVAKLVDGIQSAGEHSVRFSAIGGSASGGNGSNLPSGIYIYKLMGSNFSISKKMLLLK